MNVVTPRELTVEGTAFFLHLRCAREPLPSVCARACGRSGPTARGTCRAVRVAASGGMRAPRRSSGCTRGHSGERGRKTNSAPAGSSLPIAVSSAMRAGQGEHLPGADAPRTPHCSEFDFSRARSAAAIDVLASMWARTISRAACLDAGPGDLWSRFRFGAAGRSGTGSSASRPTGRWSRHRGGRRPDSFGLRRPVHPGRHAGCPEGADTSDAGAHKDGGAGRVAAPVRPVLTRARTAPGPARHPALSVSAVP